MSAFARLKPYAQLLAAAFIAFLPASTLYVVALMAVPLAFFVARELVGYARAGLKRQAG